jgi:hypothetical protein
MALIANQYCFADILENQPSSNCNLRYTICRSQSFLTHWAQIDSLTQRGLAPLDDQTHQTPSRKSP